jgi:hypothetical protein
MRQRLRSHLTYANVVSTFTLFLVLGGGTALASYVISSNGQVAPGTISGHHPPSGDHANIIGASVNGADVQTNSLTGADIQNQSGVETCQFPLLRRGAICAYAPGGAMTLSDALNYCAANGFRLPTASEGITMAKLYDVPGVDPALFQDFWTDSYFFQNNNSWARVVREDGSSQFSNVITSAQVVCVTDPDV